MVMTNQIKFKIHSMRTLASPYKRTERTNLQKKRSIICW